MKVMDGWLLMWVVAVLRIVGGMPYTWTALDWREEVLQPRRRRILLPWSCLVVVYLSCFDHVFKASSEY